MVQSSNISKNEKSSGKDEYPQALPVAINTLSSHVLDNKSNFINQNYVKKVNENNDKSEEDTHNVGTTTKYQNLSGL